MVVRQVFTEALLHTTLPWTGQGERRTLFVKYSPTATAWSGALNPPQKSPRRSSPLRRSGATISGVVGAGEYYDGRGDERLVGYGLSEGELALLEPPNARHAQRSWLLEPRL